MFIAAFFLPQTLHVGACQWVSRIETSRSHRVKRLSVAKNFHKQVKCGGADSFKNDGYEKLAELFGPPRTSKKMQQNRSRRGDNQRNGSDMQEEEIISSHEHGVSNSVSKVERGPPTKSEEYKRFEEMLAESNRRRARPKPVKHVRNEELQDLPTTNTERVVITEEKIEEENEDTTRSRAQMYEEMEQLLGPPEGRFQRNKDPSQVEPKDVNASGGAGKATKKSNEKPNLSNAADSDGQPMQNVQKIAMTFEEEYELLEANLRAGKPSNKPRRGRKPYPSMFAELDGIIEEPWRVDYNLMPKKGLREQKPVPTKKASKRPMPEVLEISLEGIQQSYWVLEKILHDEEKEWNEEQDKLRRAEEEKRLKKQARRNARREARNAALSAAESANASVPYPETADSSLATSYQAPPVAREESKSTVSESKTRSNPTSPQKENGSTVTEPAGALKKKYPPHLMLSKRQGKLGALELTVVETRPPNFLEGVNGLGFPEMVHRPVEESEAAKASNRTPNNDGKSTSDNAAMLLNNPKLIDDLS